MPLLSAPAFLERIVRPPLWVLSPRSCARWRILLLLQARNHAGNQVLERLARGRRCHDLQKVRWHSGDFPGGPGPDGGVILD
ncbi:hypothetical protein ASG77_11750 [Arthrobacter sp. Soil762]|nr:hypothetical protein ASG77_11750 [Arthrobacter sp. Soil762]